MGLLFCLVFVFNSRITSFPEFFLHRPARDCVIRLAAFEKVNSVLFSGQPKRLDRQALNFTPASPSAICSIEQQVSFYIKVAPPLLLAVRWKEMQMF